MSKGQRGAPFISWTASLTAQLRADAGERTVGLADVPRLENQVDMLRGRLKAKRRAGKRQSAPFSNGEPPSVAWYRPGRKPGAGLRDQGQGAPDRATATAAAGGSARRDSVAMG